MRLAKEIIWPKQFLKNFSHIQNFTQNSTILVVMGRTLLATDDSSAPAGHQEQEAWNPVGGYTLVT